MPREFLDDFQTIDLGDKRLNCRANTLLGTLSAMPSASINAACPTWPETDAAYKFFDNDRVSPVAIMDAIRAATEHRIDQHAVVLIVQDTTEIDFTGHPAEDSGVLTQENSFGIYDHSHVAFTPEGLCLGVVGVEFFEREPGTLGEASKKKKSLQIEEKESYRWLKGARLVTELKAAHPNTKIISVADRECDIHDLFAEQFTNENAGNFIIRAAQNRRGIELDEEAGGRTYKKVRDEVANSEVHVVREMRLPRTPKRAARDAKFHVRAKRVRVKPPHMRESLGEVEYNLILMEEVSCDPDDPTKVEWLLITTLPIDSPEEILQVVDYYVGRWPIEIFFKVYKSGCRVEEMQLGTTIRRKRALLFYKVIASWIMYSTYLGRECPDLSCNEIFPDDQWKPVWKVVTDEPLPNEPPTLAEFIPMVAQLGGYNNRNQDLPPGPQAIWVGMRRMLDFSKCWNAFGPDVKNE